MSCRVFRSRREWWEQAQGNRSRVFVLDGPGDPSVSIPIFVSGTEGGHVTPVEMQYLGGKRIEGLKGRRERRGREREHDERVCSPVLDSLTYILLSVFEHRRRRR